VVFQYDEGLAAHQRVEEILHEIHEVEAARTAVAAPAEAPVADDGPAAAATGDTHDPDPPA
jgi:hypothetical protein